MKKTFMVMLSLLFIGTLAAADPPPCKTQPLYFSDQFIEISVCPGYEVNMLTGLQKFPTILWLTVRKDSSVITQVFTGEPAFSLQVALQVMLAPLDPHVSATASVIHVGKTRP